MAYLVNEASICTSSGGLTSFLLLPDFRNNLGNILSCAILELLLLVAIETKICEDVVVGSPYRRPQLTSVSKYSAAHGSLEHS